VTVSVTLGQRGSDRAAASDGGRAGSSTSWCSRGSGGRRDAGARARSRPARRRRAVGAPRWRGAVLGVVQGSS
jgi:hypothetical protein